MEDGSSHREMFGEMLPTTDEIFPPGQSEQWTARHSKPNLPETSRNIERKGPVVLSPRTHIDLRSRALLARLSGCMPPPVVLVGSHDLLRGIPGIGRSSSALIMEPFLDCARRRLGGSDDDPEDTLTKESIGLGEMYWGGEVDRFLRVGVETVLTR